ncbi:MAG: hypothetical protein SNJ74_04850 [Fimbriimonadaceae bacterium]
MIIRITLARCLPVALAFTALAAPTFAQITRQGDAFLMRMRFTPNTTMSYQISTTITPANAPQGKAAPQGMNFPMSIRVISVNRQGVATVEYTIGPMTMGGQKSGQAQTMRAEMDNRGRLVGNSNPQLQGLSSMTLPEGPIRIGGTWTSKISAPGMPGGSGMDATYRLQRIEGQGARQVAVIQVTTTGNMGGMQVSGSGTMSIRMSDGSLESATLNQRITAPAQGKGTPMTLNSTTRMTRT